MHAPVGILLRALLITSTSQVAAAPPGTEVVYYLGDPQIGFSDPQNHTDWHLDAARFGQAAAAAAADPRTAAVVVAGDLVNIWNSSDQIQLYKSVWPSKFPACGVHQVPGNHDVNSELTSVPAVLAALEHYKTTFERDDYSNTTTRFASLIMVNTEMLILPHLGLNGTTDPRILKPVEAQWAWLEAQLAAAQATVQQRPHIVITMHHPPFLQHETEPHQYFNMPIVPRVRMLALARKYGVRTFLCGHTHTTTNTSTADGIRVYTTAGTARAFDHRGCGYRTLTMSATTLDVSYVELPGGGGAPGCVRSTHPRFNRPSLS